MVILQSVSISTSTFLLICLSLYLSLYLSLSPPVCLFLRLSAHLSLSVSLSICLYIISLSIHLITRLFIDLSLYLSLSIYLFIRLWLSISSFCLSTSLSVSIYRSISLSVSLSPYLCLCLSILSPSLFSLSIHLSFYPSLHLSICPCPTGWALHQHPEHVRPGPGRVWFCVGSLRVGRARQLRQGVTGGRIPRHVAVALMPQRASAGPHQEGEERRGPGVTRHAREDGLQHAHRDQCVGTGGWAQLSAPGCSLVIHVYYKLA